MHTHTTRHGNIDISANIFSSMDRGLNALEKKIEGMGLESVLVRERERERERCYIDRVESPRCGKELNSHGIDILEYINQGVHMDEILGQERSDSVFR